MKNQNYFQLLFLLLATILFGACHQDKTDYSKRSSYFENLEKTVYSDSTLRCITYNIQLGFKAGNDPWNSYLTGGTKEHIKALAKHLLAFKPDLIALQEVPRNRSNNEVKDFLEQLASQMQMNYAFGAHGFNDATDIYPLKGEWGNAILSSFEIIDINNYEIEYVDQWERRSLLQASLRLNENQEISMISLHHLPSKESIPNTAAFVSQLTTPFILTGDFNINGPIPEFDNLGLVDVDSTYFQHAIDRFFVNPKHWQVLEIGVLNDAERLSDHAANFCILKRLE